ncbi:acyltransferase family protein [Shewanella frigidimarina]|uniref:acyltransferase family protein n=1 Tax=Shewanella frigidimarina TaxID=56812 RepID=UPI003D7BA6A6
MNERAVWVDYSKAIGIMLVVYGHVIRGVYNSSIPMNAKFYELSNNIVYSFHMPLFFFLAGLYFFKSLSEKGKVGLIYSKLDSIIYPYIIWSIFQGVIERAFSEFTNGTLSFFDVFSFLWAPRAQFWFLYYLFIFFFFASFLFSNFSRLYVTTSFLLCTCLYIFSYSLFEYSSFVLLLLYFIFFLMGIVFSFKHDWSFLKKESVVLLLGTNFFALQFIYFYYYGFNYTQHGIHSLYIAAASVAFVVSLSFYISKYRLRLRFLSYLGFGSMAIYLMHIVVSSGVRVFLEKVFDIQNSWFHLFLGFLFGLLIPLGVFSLINRYGVKYIFSAPMSFCLRGFLK